MTLETGLALGGFAISVGTVGISILVFVRRVTQSEERIKNDIKGLSTATTTDLKNLAESQSAGMKGLEDRTAATIKHHNELSALRVEEVGRRIGRVEETIGRITQIVVHSERGGP